VTHAITRRVPASFVKALAREAPEAPIDVDLARRQHVAYGAALQAMGATVTVVDADEACPDCVFVEDTAVVAAGLALITIPGAPSRRTETPAIATALAGHVEIRQMEAPATLDGGDVMRVGSTIYVGRSARTNEAGIASLAAAFTPRGLRVVALDLPPDVLHLKCVCTPLGDDRIVLAEGSLSPALFGDTHCLIVPAAETYAANVVAIRDHVMVAAEYPRTLDVLVGAGFHVHPVPTTEVRKADGSLTCQSIVILMLVIGVLAGACGSNAAAPVTSNQGASVETQPKPAPTLDELIGLLETHRATPFSAEARDRGCPRDQTVGEYVDTLVRIGREGEDPVDVHSLTGGCGEWPSEDAMAPIDPPRDGDFFYCKVDSRTSDPAGESPWHYELRVRVARHDLTVDLATAGCPGTP
jgi:dimethylargininase